MTKRTVIFELEPRIMFDAAGVAVVEANTSSVDSTSSDTSDQNVSPIVAMYSESLQKSADKITQSYQEALTTIGQFIQNDESLAQIREIFKTQSSEITSEQLENLRTQILDGTYTINIKILDAETMGVAMAAYSAEGTDGTAVIYVNGDWALGADTTELQHVMIEEIGHSFDTYLNGTNDSVGDEGERFSALLNGTLTDTTGLDNDNYTMTIGNVVTHVELATFNFTNAYEMVYDLNNDGSINPAERWADKEQNSHYFNTASLGPVTIDDGNYNSADFSGNDVSAIGINIGGKTYYGWVSRPIKSGGIVRGFYFWTDTNFTDLATAQADGNQDGDSTVTDNRGFLLVVDQSWFTTQIATNSTYNLNNAKDGNLGSVVVSNIGSSSDRVDSALNSLITTSVTPTLTDDSASAAVELGSDSGSVDGVTYNGASLSSNSGTVTLTSTTSVQGNVLSNDTAGSGTLMITAISSTETGSKIAQLTAGSYTLNAVNSSGAYIITGKYGVLTIDAKGNYSYTPSNSAAIVDALRTGTVTETFSYTVTNSDGKTATATLTTSVQGSNDAPVAYNDYNTAKEKDTASSTVGYNAEGNVLTNDTDVDTGDTKSIVGTSSLDSTPLSVNVVTGTTQLVFSSANGASLASAIVGGEVFYYNGTNYYALADANGKNVYGSSYTTDASGNYVVTFNANVTQYWDGTQLQSVSNLTTFFDSHPTVRFADRNAPTDSPYVFVTSAASNQGKAGASLSSQSSAYTQLTYSGNVSASYSVGMLVTGSGVPAGTTVTAVTYNGTNTIVTTTNQLSGVTNVTLLSYYSKTTLTGTYGTLTLYANGDYVYAPTVDGALTQGQSATETFTYTMKDTAGVQSRANLLITVYGSGTNDPLLTNDTASITEQGVNNGGNVDNAAAGTITGNVLTNDKETGSASTIGTGYVKTIRNEANTSTSTIGTDTVKNNDSSASVIGVYGSIVMQDDGDYTYTLSNSAALVQALQSGVAVTDTFYYQVKNTLTSTASSWAKLTITINGANDIPVAVTDTGSVYEDGNTVSTGNVVLNDSDVDTSDTKTVTYIGTTTASISVNSGTTSTTGTTVSGTYGDLKIGADGTYSYVLNNNAANVQALTMGQQVTDTFTYKITDSKGATTTASVVITVNGADDRPMIAVAGVDIEEGSSAIFEIDLTNTGATLSNVNVALSLSNLTTSSTDYDGTTYYWSTDNTNWVAVSGNTIQLSSIPNGVSSFYVKVATTDDNVYEGLESFVLNASFSDASLKYANGVSGAIRANSYSDGTVNIYDDGTATDGDDANGTSDNDKPQMSIGNVTVEEGSTAVFNVTVGEAKAPYTVTFGTDFTGQTADVNDINATFVVKIGGVAVTPNGDGSYTIPAGTTALSVEVSTTDNSIYEGSETFLLTGKTQFMSTETTGIGTIKDDGSASDGDDAGSDSDDDRPTITIGDATIEEGSSISFAASLSNASAYNEIFTLSSSLLTAEAADFVSDKTTWSIVYGVTTIHPAADGSFTLPAGVTSFTIKIPTTDDNVYEGSETFTLGINATSSYITDSDTGLGTIKDDGTADDGDDANDIGPVTDPNSSDNDKPTLSINSVNVDEGNKALFTVSLDKLSDFDTVFDLSTLAGTATGSGTDFTNSFEVSTDSTSWTPATSGTITAGTQTLYVRIPTSDDATSESNETFDLKATVTSGTVKNAGGIATGTATILDNDGAPSFSIEDITINEGTGTATITVTLSQSSTNMTTVDFTTADNGTGIGKAIAGVDYTATNNTLTFNAGDRTKTITLTIANDNIYEYSEYFHINLSNATGGAEISDSQGIVTIKDDGTGSGGTDNDMPTMSITDDSKSEGSTLRFEATVSNPIAMPMPVRIELGSGTAGVSDYSNMVVKYLDSNNVEQILGATSGTTYTVPAMVTRLYIYVDANTDSIHENNEQFSVNVIVNNGGTDYVTAGTGTILDVNNAPLANNDIATTEKDTPVTISVRGNDTDLDNDPLSITAITQGVHGTVTIVNGNVVYTPAAGFTGTDTFIYTISDGNGHTSTATVTVNVNDTQQPYVSDPIPTPQPKTDPIVQINVQQNVETDTIITKTLDRLQEQDNQTSTNPIQKEMQYVEQTYRSPSRNEDSIGIQVNNTGRVVLEFAGQHETTQMNVVEVKAFQMDPKFVRIAVKDTQYKDGDAKFELFALDGTKAPEWLKIDSRTGLITGIPPKGVEKVVVQVKILGKDGKIKTVDVEINVVKKNTAAMNGTLSAQMEYFTSQYRSSDELNAILNKTVKGA